MIHCNLSVLLAERRIRISKVAADTGISRTTLTALAQNDSKGIQLNTLNTLCIYLGISPGELFAFSPVEIIPESAVGLDTVHFRVQFAIQSRRGIWRCCFDGYIREGTEIVFYLTSGVDNEPVGIELMNTMKKLPIVLIRDIESDLVHLITKSVLPKFNSCRSRIEGGESYQVVWPDLKNSEQKEKPSEEG